MHLAMPILHRVINLLLTRVIHFTVLIELKLSSDLVILTVTHALASLNECHTLVHTHGFRRRIDFVLNHILLGGVDLEAFLSSISSIITAICLTHTFVLV